MTNMKVIIPAAKIVPEELQKLGKLPGIIYPVNQKITFDYLYEEYKEHCSSMDIICFEKADKVQRRLKNYLGEKVSINFAVKSLLSWHPLHIDRYCCTYAKFP